MRPVDAGRSIPVYRDDCTRQLVRRIKEAGILERFRPEWGMVGEGVEGTARKAVLSDSPAEQPSAASALQCRKCRIPVKTMAMPSRSAAAITSWSFTEPPG